MIDNDRISENDILASALHYYDLGFSVIPVGQNKIPLIDWKKYQQERVDKETIKNWWRQFPKANIGVITGAISGIIVIDVEAGGKVENLPPTVISRTGGGGWHYFYKHPQRQIKNAVRIFDKTDIRGDGGYVVMPPSLHKSGNRYEWIVSPEIADFVELPHWILDKITNDKEKINWNNFLNSEILEGARNMSAAQFAGKLFFHLPPELWEISGWATVREWNLNQNKPPLDEKELRSVWESIKKREKEKRMRYEESDNKNFKEKFKLTSLSELMLKEFENTAWIVEKLVPSQGITAISGAPAAYKTWFTLDMALKIASGDILFDKFTTAKSGVLFVDEENGERLLQQRFKKLNKSFEIPIYFLSLMGFQLSKDTVLNIIKIAKEKDIKVVIFDSLVRIHRVNENDATEMAGVFKHIKQLNKEGLTVIFTHHNRKQSYFKGSPSQNMRGSSDILASVDCHLALEKNQKEEFITIIQAKLRQEHEIKPFKLGIISDENSFSFEYFGDVDEIQTKKGDCKEAIKEILERKAKPMYKKELFDSLRNGGLEVGYSTFKTTTKEMSEAGEIFEERGEKNKIFCSLESLNKTESIIG